MESETRDSGRGTRNLGPGIEHLALNPGTQKLGTQPSAFEPVSVTWELPSVAVEVPYGFCLLL